MNMRSIIWCCVLVLCGACASQNATEKHQNRRDRIISVHDRVKAIEVTDVLIGAVSRPYIMGDYLLVIDPMSNGKLVHLFDKTTFEYRQSVVQRGMGPGEIVNMGELEVDALQNRFYISDHGKRAIYSFDLDSVRADPLYEPSVKTSLTGSRFPSKYNYVNDTLSFALIIEPTGQSGFNQSVARWNMATGEMIPMPYKHPEVEQKRVSLALSLRDSLYVECYSNYDLMTICDLNGHLRCNVYGPNWTSERSLSNPVHYYGDVAICNDKIVAAYSGGSGDERYFPTRFEIFDLNGNYLRTLDVGYNITGFCYDAQNHRLIMVLDSMIQFAYLDVSEFLQ